MHRSTCLEAVSDDAPFCSASTAISFPCSTMETMNLSLAVEEGAELAGLECALNEIERVRRCVCVCVCVCV